MGISSNSPGHLTFVHLISLTFNKKKERFFYYNGVKQMNSLLSLNHNQSLNKLLSGATGGFFV